jgi:hypothetical protein
MIRSYKYLDTAVQLKLHEIIIAFFNRIEFERGQFKETFFGAALGMLAKRHREIIRDRCTAIYNEIKDWDLGKRTKLFNAIRESNDIEGICRGSSIPQRIDNTANGFDERIRTFFIDLYDQVLNGNPFNEQYSTSLSQHFDAFSKLNSDITLCPVCGIGELKKHTDDIRDQYDHYLPKALYPFSSVNFKNLVPICRECNSLDVKGDEDVIAVSTNKKLFFLYDEKHRGITVAFQIVNDDIDPNNIQWQITFSNPDNKNDEIESWKTIYKIESRYRGFVNARIEKFYRHYWEFINDSDIAHLAIEDRKLACFKSYEKDESLQLNFIRKPALVGFLTGSTLSQAAIEARHYSIPATA